MLNSKKVQTTKPKLILNIPAGPLFVLNEPGFVKGHRRRRPAAPGGLLGTLGSLRLVRELINIGAGQRNKTLGVGCSHLLFILDLYRWLLKKRPYPYYVFINSTASEHFFSSILCFLVYRNACGFAVSSNFRINPGLRRSNRRWEEQIASQKSRRRCVRKYGLHCRM